MSKQSSGWLVFLLALCAMAYVTFPQVWPRTIAVVLFAIVLVILLSPLVYRGWMLMEHAYYTSRRRDEAIDVYDACEDLVGDIEQMIQDPDIEIDERFKDEYRGLSGGFTVLCTVYRDFKKKKLADYEYVEIKHAFRSVLNCLKEFKKRMDDSIENLPC